MKTFTFNIGGKMVSVQSKDADRARCQAKRACGESWTPKAKLVKITNAM